MKDKVILFDGNSLEGFVNCETRERAAWEVKDGVMTVNGTGDIRSVYEFGDALIHVEFCLPHMPEAEGQDKGNSGVYIQGCYELQVLDSSGKPYTNISECGAIYEMYAPLINATKAPGEWQAYDIILKSAKLHDNGELKEPAVVSIIFNGNVIHNNVPLTRRTPGGCYRCLVERGPLMLQDHDCPVSYRNIWVQPLD
ncbi:MAG: DUF1080 domain-containing protein [Clostridia bacterium]|nr:DUF1080 domain-containing protein [Clostridia bacterium]